MRTAMLTILLIGVPLFSTRLGAQTPPAVATPPTNVVAVSGGSVTLSVSATGTGPLSYQWYFNGSPVVINGTIITIVGGGAGDGTPATSADVADPTDVAIDAAGNLFIADNKNNRIRKVGTNGIISTVAGNGRGGYAGDGGPATSASLYSPGGVALDAAGNLFIADGFNNRIRKVDTNGIITTVAGMGPTFDYTTGKNPGTYSGDGAAATNAQFDLPATVTVDLYGNLFIADYHNNRIRKVDTNGIITTVVGNGSGSYSGDGGTATNASINGPSGVTLNGSGSLFIGDFSNNRIREVGTNGVITTVAGNGSSTYSGDGGVATNATLNLPIGVHTDSAGNLFFSDSGNGRIRKVDTHGVITTVAGNGTFSYSGDGGAATNAAFWIPCGLTVDPSGNLFIADQGNNRIRKVETNGIIVTAAGNGSGAFAGDGGAATNAALSDPSGLALDGMGNLFIADSGNNCIRELGTNGIITTVAGNSSSGFWGDGGAATNAEFYFPTSVAVDTEGNLFIADTYNNRVRKRGVDGIISTLAGNATGGLGSGGYSGDGGAATNASLNMPFGVTLGTKGSLFIADTYNYRIRELGSNGIITTVAGDGSSGYSADGSTATNAELDTPRGVATDGVGNLYITDSGNNRIRKVGTNGVITTAAGNGNSSDLGDGGPATNASLSYPTGVMLDASGNLFICDMYDSRIREVGTNGIIATVAGNGSFGYLGDGGAATNAELYSPQALAVDDLGDILIADSENNVVREVLASHLSLGSGGASLVISSLSSANFGNYYVVISNAYGSATSSVASVSLPLIRPFFTAIAVANGAVQLNYSGAASNNYVLYSATNLSPPVTWTPLITNIADNMGNVTVVDTNINRLTSKFYRASSP